MKVLLLGCGLVAALPAVAQRPAPAQQAAASRPPTDAYTSLLNRSKDVARLLRRAMAEPDDTKALAIIESRETVGLKKRAEQLNPKLSSWVNTLSEEQKKAFEQRFLKESPLMQYLDSLEHNPQVKARMEHSPSLQNAIQSFVYYTM